MELAEFSQRLASCSGLTSAQKALGILWFESSKDHSVSKTSSQLARSIRDFRIGNPNPAQLESQIRKLRLTIRANGAHTLKADARSTVVGWFGDAIRSFDSGVPHDDGYLPAGVWAGTRGYIENVCKQLNGCYYHAFHDAASVMVRRLVETLIIECYEHLGRDAEIRDGDGNPFMLGELVNRSTGQGGLSLGRDSKKALKEVKEVGDRAAHNRRFTAVQADLDKIRSGVRLAVDEMVQLASLKRQPTSSKTVKN
jgi:hypothetical protein